MSSDSLELTMQTVADFKSRHGLADETDRSIVTTIHLMNAHQVDLAGAQERTSRGGSDHGIDGWYLDGSAGSLFVYQSRLGSTRGQVLKGLENLLEAAEWIGSLWHAPESSRPSLNTAINNLTNVLTSPSEGVRRVELVLLSALPVAEIEDTDEVAYARTDCGKTSLFKTLKQEGGKLTLQAGNFDLDSGGIGEATPYDVATLQSTHLALGKRSELLVTIVSLYSLVALLRKRGNLVFEKNVRLHLNTKESRTRVEHPLETTLTAITDGKLDPNFFPAYHVGVAITASACELNGSDGRLVLESPYIINGCQTVSVAHRFLAKLEKAKQVDKIERFKSIHVIAKVVTRAPEDQLREIATCNNRQNPIDAWQLFSNDPIHVEIEAALRDQGIFYERQKGKFASQTPAQLQNAFQNTNGTFVELVGLGQGIAVCRRELALAAKPSEIFASKEGHDELFSADLPSRTSDVVWTFNAMKALKRSLTEYIKQATHADETSQSILSRPVVRQGLYHVAMLHLIQKRDDLHWQFISKLYKRASPTIVDALEPVWKRSVAKMKRFCTDEAEGSKGEVSLKRLDEYVQELADQLGLSPSGPMPFTPIKVAWPSGEDDAELTM